MMERKIKLSQERNKELVFAQTLEEIKKLAKEQGGVVLTAQIEEAFYNMGLTKEQLEPVYQYLNAKNIGIGEPVDLEEKLLGTERDYLEDYMRDLEGIRRLTSGEKEAFLYRAMAGEEEAKMVILNHFLSDVVDIAKLYIGQGVLLEDLIGEGNLALAGGVELLGSMESAEEAEGMLVKYVMDSMENYIKENSDARQFDLQMAEKVNYINEQAKELAESLHKKITMKELSEETGIKEEEIEEAIRLSGNKIEYFEN